jgi:dTDP-4-dehydrorhamnose reductase
MKKIMLLGSAGMTGQILKKKLLNLNNQIELIDIARSNKISTPKIELDITNFNQLKEIILNNNFDFIINCIGILNNAAEKNPAQAILINSYLPHYLEKITFESNTKIIHLSTDCVFSGKNGSYIESSLKDGIGFYAQSKSLGEIINEKDLTIRTSIIGPDLNENGIGLFNWILNQTGSIKGYKSAYWSGVTSIQLANFIIENILRSTLPTGLIHLTNNIKISKYDLLGIIKDIFQLKNIVIEEEINYQIDKSLINTRSDLKLNVPTYFDMILETKEWITQNKYLVK